MGAKRRRKDAAKHFSVRVKAMVQTDFSTGGANTRVHTAFYNSRGRFGEIPNQVGAGFR